MEIGTSYCLDTSLGTEQYIIMNFMHISKISTGLCVVFVLQNDEDHILETLCPVWGASFLMQQYCLLHGPSGFVEVPEGTAWLGCIGWRPLGNSDPHFFSHMLRQTRPSRCVLACCPSSASAVLRLWLYFVVKPLIYFLWFFFKGVVGRVL